MNSSPNPQHEPTMEEILASIRKIISEDQPDSTNTQTESASEPQPPAEEPPTETPEIDVLELTEEVHEETTVSQPEPVSEAAPEPPPEPEPPRPQPRPIQDDVAFETTEEREPSPMEPDDLISDTTHDAVGKAFATLDDIQSQPAAPAGTLDEVFIRAVQDAFAPTLQDWVNSHQAEITDQLKPMIRQWMDEHLPPLIEAAVAKEISRVVAARRR